MPPKAAAAPAKVSKKAAKDAAPKVKRAPSPYIIFCTENRDKVKAANPDATFGQLGKLLGEGWAKLSDAQKKVTKSKYHHFSSISNNKNSKIAIRREV